MKATELIAKLMQLSKDLGDFDVVVGNQGNQLADVAYLTVSKRDRLIIIVPKDQKYEDRQPKD